MKLLLIRHADAGDRDEFAKTGDPDSRRPLSEKGRTQMRSAADGLRRLVPRADLIVTSPYTRAVETANLVSDAYSTPIEETETLEPESAPENFEAWVRDRTNAALIIAVGHEPHLGAMATWLMCGTPNSHIEFKKGGACLLEFDGAIAKSAGMLRWLMGPKELAALA